MTLTKIDAMVIFVIFVLAGILRFPNLGNPNRIIFDESVSTTFIMEYLYKKPYFDVHPPLMPMIYSKIAGLFRPEYQNKIENHDGIFGDFPYLPLRFINVILGCIIPV